MKSATVLLAITALLASGCQRAAEPLPGAGPSPSASAVAQAAPCAPAPTLEESQDFSDPRDVFTDDAPEFDEVAANFAAAYARACDDGVFAKGPLLPADVPHPGRVYVITAPDANVASIYRGEQYASDTPGDMVLEYPFLGEGDRKRIPTVDELYEAIYCAAVGATEQEQEEGGRCLPD